MEAFVDDAKEMVGREVAQPMQGTPVQDVETVSVPPAEVTVAAELLNEADSAMLTLVARRKATADLLQRGLNNSNSIISQTLAAFAKIVDGKTVKTD